MTIAGATALEHLYFCTPRPGEDGPRIEAYTSPRYSQDGISQIGAVRCVRCLECGVTSYDGVQPRS